MEKLVVHGGKRLCGSVVVGGSKNAALPILFGGILTGDICVFSRLPRVSDVLQALEILKYLGASIHFERNGDVAIDYRDLRPLMPPEHLTSRIRGSTYLLGSLLGRFGKVSFAGSGGCDFGKRPIDLHLMGFARLGAKVEEKEGILTVDGSGGLTAANIELAIPSVGATANLLLAATAASGETALQNAAAEPHVAALAAFLAAAGAEIDGANTDCLRVRGISALHGCHVQMIPDMIEAGTYLCATAVCGGEVCVEGIFQKDLCGVCEAFAKMGLTIKENAEGVTLCSDGTFDAAHLVTGPYPAFPTDLHPQFAALFACGGHARGCGSVCERVWASRFRYVEELARMGAHMEVAGDTVSITPAPLHAAAVTAPDLRGGAALLLAALATKGKSEVRAAKVLARGYEHLCEKCRALGADVRTVE